MKPNNGSIASLYDQVERHVRPWLNHLDNIQDENLVKHEGNISLTKLKQSLEKLLIEKNQISNVDYVEKKNVYSCLH